MESFFEKIFRQNDFEAITGEQETGGISLGRITNREAGYLISCFNIWVKRIDTLIQMDKDRNNGEPTQVSHRMNKYRGFTFHEYHPLFNKAISDPSEFHKYPVFNQLKFRNRRGVRSERDRTFFISQLEYNEEDYVRCLYTFGFETVCEFFFGFSKFNCYFPLSKMFQHILISAPSGSGKTVLLETLFFRMTHKYKKYSFVLIDPHGDISERARKHRHLQERCVYIDAFLDPQKTPTFNPFDIRDRSLRNINNTAEAVILAFSEVLSREGGDLTETMVNMLEKCCYFLLQRPNSTILDLVTLLDRDPEIFEEASKYDKFFNEFFQRQNNKTREGLLNRIGRLLNSPILFNLIGGKSTFDLEKAINQNKVIIFNLGGLGEMSQIAFGKLIIAHVKSCVRKRKKPSKKHTFLLVEETSNFVGGGSDSFTYILSQLRGFGLHMILSSQFIEQFGSQIKSVQQNTCIKILGGGSDNMDDIRKMLKVSKNARLEDYNFFLKIRGRTLLTFKSPSTLLKGKKKHYLTDIETEAFDNFQLRNYYKAIGTKPNEPVREKIKEVEPISKNSPNPDLGLYINDND